MISIPLFVLASLLPWQQPTWRLGAAPGYTLVTTAGFVTDPGGATLAMRSDSAPPTAFGSISGSIPADSFRLRRVRIVADIEAKDVVGGGVSPWLRVDGPNGMLSLDNGSDNAIRGTNTGRREVTVYVPENATRLVFGLLLGGRGEGAARGLRLESRPLVAANTPLGPAAQRMLDSALTIVRKHSLWRDTVTWTKVEPEVRGLAAGAESAADVHQAIRYLLTRLGDHHSFMMRPTATRQFQQGGAQNPRPVIKALLDSIGYISVPAYSGSDPKASLDYAKGVQDSLGVLLPQTNCRWVVDLRSNGGGNMWPMLGGLRPFFGEVGLGSFVSAAGSAPLWRANVVDVKPTRELAMLDSATVAVLTGPRTASSGEAVTISFIGRPRTRLFGLATAGLSTANQGFSLPDSSMILLTVSVEADRNGKRYGEKIDPDEVIPVAAAGNGDPQLDRAVAWLKAQPAVCKR